MQADPTAEIHPLPHNYPRVMLLSSFPAATWSSPLLLRLPDPSTRGPLELQAQGTTDLYPWPLLCVLWGPPPSPAALSVRGCLVSHTSESGGGPMSSLFFTVSFRPCSSSPLPPINTQHALVPVFSYTTSPSPHWCCIPTSWTFPPSQRLWSWLADIFKPWYHPEWLLTPSKAQVSLTTQSFFSSWGNDTSSMPPQPLMDLYCPLLTVLLPPQ